VVYANRGYPGVATVTDVLIICVQILEEAGFTTETATASRQSIVFENDTVLGFVSIYEDTRALIRGWQTDLDRLVEAYQLALRRSGDKAWNAYAVMISAADANYSESVVLGAIEEDLVGVRKIARSGTKDVADLREALLPLLPLQNAPKLEAVDMGGEIRIRTTELPGRAVEAFLSDAEQGVVIQVLEEDE
jgi:hypothetical protein